MGAIRVGLMVLMVMHGMVQAAGRFSDNAVLVEAGPPTILTFHSWLPLDAQQLALLTSSLRVEHLADNL